MKNKSLKLFLLLGVIALSLVAFASCKKTDGGAVTPEENTGKTESEESGEQQAPKPYLSEITDGEYIEFVLENYATGIEYDWVADEAVNSGLLDLYSNYCKNENIVIKEYITSGSTKLIAGYIPRESIELIFEMGADVYLDKFNEFSMYKMLTYLEREELSYGDIGFRLYYVNEKNAKTNFDDQFMIYMGEEGFASDKGGNTIRLIRNLCTFGADESLELYFCKIEDGFFPKSTMVLKEAITQKFLTGFNSKCTVFDEENGEKNTVFEYDEYISKNFMGKEFLAAFSDAELYAETTSDSYSEYGDKIRVYNYEKVKEILNVKD